MGEVAHAPQGRTWILPGVPLAFYRRVDLCDHRGQSLGFIEQYGNPRFLFGTQAADLADCGCHNRVGRFNPKGPLQS
jgi:hypothetical protein